MCQFQPSDNGSGGMLGALSVLPASAGLYDRYIALLAVKKIPTTPVTLTY